MTTCQTHGSTPISVVIPCLNEAGSIAICVERARQSLRESGLEGEVVVADNSSTDNSAILAANAGARVVSVPRRGYGNALRAGIQAARNELVVIGDGDLTYDFAEISRLLQPILSGDADLVLGNRLKGRMEPGAMPWTHQYFGTPFLTWILNRLYGLKVADSQSGMRAFRLDAIRRLGLRAEGMEFASEMLARSARAGLRVAEVPINYARVHTGRATHLRPLRDGWRHVRFLLLFGPFGFFLYPGLFSTAVGVLLIGAAVGQPVISGHKVSFHFAIFGGMLALVGIQTIILGVSARTYSAIQGYVTEGFIPRLVSGEMKWRSVAGAGAALALLGTLGALFVLVSWLRGRLGPLVPADTVAAVLSSTLIVLGFQLCFLALLMELMQTRAAKREIHE